MDKVNFCAFGIYMINFVILRLQFLNDGKRQETGRTYCMLYGICDIRNQYNRMQRPDGGTSDLTYSIVHSEVIGGRRIVLDSFSFRTT